MSDKFHKISAAGLLTIIINEYENRKSIFGIESELFYKPEKKSVFNSIRYGKVLGTPLGVAAGPHTQLAQNIISAWLAGARFIELKTVQVLDELEVSKPCIDMQDEGYNCEWSQELKIKESFDEYLTAWILIHVINHYLGWEDEIGTIFNMSVGYNLEGIKSEKIEWFFSKMKNCKPEKEKKINELSNIYPEIVNIAIPDQISNNITLSTMHGCPPYEILEIGKYLINNKELHTTIKLNPTLLGAPLLRNILNQQLGFETQIPDLAFEHDLKYPEAIEIIKELRKLAKNKDLYFGLKLTNTLESLNHKDIFDRSNEMMYMSGRALHPIAINLSNKLQKEFNGELSISFSAGADCFNISDIVSCNLSPVTVCSDLLKPGGYGRIKQYIDELNSGFKTFNAQSINDLIKTKSSSNELNIATLENLSNYTETVLKNPAYKKTGFIEPSIKTERTLSDFDCIQAPCVDTCPTNQDIPEYIYYASEGKFNEAFKVIMRTNPFPSVTGMVCDHLCQTKCTRINYDSPVLIREIKRFISENGNNNHTPEKQKLNGLTVAVIGAGPSGLSCAYFLALAGFKVDVYESKNKAGGMVSGAIPSFRLTDEAIQKDISQIEKLGVKIHYSQSINTQLFNNLKESNSYIFIAAGAQKASRLNIDGIDSHGVIDPLHLLYKARENKPTDIGKNVAIIGGGNSAMDAARTAYRLVGDNGKVTIIYRRTKAQMPADLGEIKAVMEEGIEIMELVSPEKIETIGNTLFLTCTKMKLGEKDKDGRRKPEKIPGSELLLKFDTIIPAIGQDLAIDFVNTTQLHTGENSYQTRMKNVFIGGDAFRGASTAINAIADGRKAAEEIIQNAHLNYKIQKTRPNKNISYKQHQINRATRIKPVEVKETKLNERKSFKQVTFTLNKEQIIEEASRCLYCDEICNICETVCPNRSNYSYKVAPQEIHLKKIINNDKISLYDDGIFSIKQNVQILNIADWCNECGNCTTFCPTGGAPYKEKPRFCLTKESFEQEDNCYMIEIKERSETIYYKTGSLISALTKKNNHYTFENNAIQFIINNEEFIPEEIQIKDKKLKEFSLLQVAKMKVLLEGAAELYC
ncbi:MAG: putative selenate reductase subunit YgfK [Chlorobi bacterium]|nr:putative selenate reductase subunit YgfK [Chlorobiota bacterium]